MMAAAFGRPTAFYTSNGQFECAHNLLYIHTLNDTRIQDCDSEHNPQLKVRSVMIALDIFTQLLFPETLKGIS